MNILSFNAVSLIMAGRYLLDQADLHIESQDRIALVGRNGAGKSTLLKLLQGELVKDSGQINKLSGLRIAGLAQEVPDMVNQWVYQILVQGLGEVGKVIADFYHLSKQQEIAVLGDCQQQMDNLHAWDLLPQIDSMASKLGINIHDKMANLSGGMRRRVLLAAALLSSPDLLLLDEPTNHLDIESIEWLESYLNSYRGSVVVVTHDRTFLSQVAKRIIEIDRGKLHAHECDYATYLERRETILLSEQRQNALFDKKLAEEEAWIRTGIKARRTRNEGRVRALKTMREEYKARRKQLGTVKTLTLDVQQSGFVVLEAEKVNYTIDKTHLIRDFSLLLTRGDKLGIIGPNGCGKTTLVRLLLGELQANSGRIKQGTSLSVAYFDQLRKQLNEGQTVLFNVADGADYVTINGKQKHVASYLKEFLFAPERFNEPVSSLSGGERNRLLLAKLLAKPVNLLVMDEPTNDLDMETLELLEQLLVDYSGSLILISHDREFINHVVTSVLIYEGNGQFSEFVGGYDDYKAYKKQNKDKIAKHVTAVKPPQTSANKLSFKDKRELEQLPKKIEALEQEIHRLQLAMAESSFYQQEPQVIADFNQKLAQEEAQLAEYYARWEMLEGH